MREFFPAYRVAHEVARAIAPRELARAQTRPSAAIVKKKRQAKKAAGVASHAFKAKPVVDHKGRPGASQIHPDAAMALAVASRMRNKP